MNGSNKILREALEKTWVKAAGIGAILTGLGVFYFLAKLLAKYIPEQYFLEIVVILLAVVLFLLTFIKTIIFYFNYERKELYPKDKSESVKENLTCIDVEYAIDELIGDIKSRGFEPDIIIGIDRGGAIVGGMLAKYLGLPLTTISSSDYWTISDSISSLDDGIKDSTKNIEKKILLVDDACRSGDTLKKAHDVLEKCKFKDLKKATILNEERMRRKPITPDFFVYKTDRSTVNMPWDKEK